MANEAALFEKIERLTKALDANTLSNAALVAALGKYGPAIEEFLENYAPEDGDEVEDGDQHLDEHDEDCDDDECEGECLVEEDDEEEEASPPRRPRRR